MPTPQPPSPITLTAFDLDGQSHRALAPLRFTVTLDTADNLLTAEGPFNIFAVGETRAALEVEIATDLAFLWREYVLSPPASLSADALDLRDELIRSFPSL